ncbi:MAG: 5-dehydro-4-deoxy-D-glucuronate isomerase [Firmicutes bacterium]|nr:5-dehydro-4-deoxy-D-glucuronate isomerase [Bacillota bacterium]
MGDIAIQYGLGPEEFRPANQGSVEERLVFRNLFHNGEAHIGYSYFDRLLVAGIVPLDTPLTLKADELLRTAFFFERREAGIVNIGGPGSVEVDGQTYSLDYQDFLYVGQGSREVWFRSSDSSKPARFYIVSAPAHAPYPVRKMTVEETERVELGDVSHANRRRLHKWIFPQGVQSSQLVMGFTVLEEGNVWNTLPPHRHARRTEVYLYYDVPAGERIIHLMGEPSALRHVVLGNEEAVVSPPWSIHMGAGTSRYAFVWATAGENTSYRDQDAVALTDLL